MMNPKNHIVSIPIEDYNYLMRKKKEDISIIQKAFEDIIKGNSIATDVEAGVKRVHVQGKEYRITYAEGLITIVNLLGGKMEYRELKYA